jgi:2,5-dichlorohydroquinone reductive dechlorinase
VGRIVVDSARICEYVDREEQQVPNLRPAKLSDEIDEMIEIVDSAPHVALLYGANPLGDHRPAMLAKMIKGVHARKEVAIRKIMAEVSDDPELIAAYESKISKEQAAARFIGDSVSMASIVGQMKEGVGQLEQQLAKHEGDWACGDVFTLADVFWAPSLFRMRAMGIGHLFGAESSCLQVAAYAERLFSRPTFRAAVVDWPGSNPPTEHIPELNTLGFKLRFMWFLLRGRF